MLNITSFYTNMEGSITVDEEPVATISANLNTGGSINISKMVTNPTLYTENIDAVLEDVKAFEQKVIKDFTAVKPAE